MSMYALLRNKEIPTTEEIEMGLQGNLCRCTGYRPIIKGELLVESLRLRSRVAVFATRNKTFYRYLEQISRRGSDA